MDSKFTVSLTKVINIKSHPNAERLDLVFVYGFQIITSKNQYKIGDTVIYVPIDSIIDEKLENILFPKDAKIRPNKGRIRQIKLRGIVSQGLLIHPKNISHIVNCDFLKEESNVASFLNIKKYEPELIEVLTINKEKKQRKNLPNVNFHSYNGLCNIKYMPTLFDYQDVVIQEKIHGTNARAGILPRPVRSLFDRIKKFLGILPEYEFVYGSREVDITNKDNYTGYYGSDIYGEVFSKMDVKSKLKPGEIVYGEIYGPGVQKGYNYGLKERKFILFDVKVFDKDGNHRWLNPEEVEDYAKERGFDMVPVLYKGIYNYELAKQLSMGPSVLCPEEKVREGCVLKLKEDYSKEGNKQALKLVSEIYLGDQSNTDNH